MNFTVLSIASRYLLPLLVVFAVFLLLRGHEEPGGGFAAALVLASALGFIGLSDGAEALWALAPAPRSWIAIGVAVAMVTSHLPLLCGRPLFEGMWLPFELEVLGGFELGTPILFDVAVFLVATGAALEIFLSLLGEG